MAQPASLLVERMVRIKQLIPQADISMVIAKRPSLLCMEVGNPRCSGAHCAAPHFAYTAYIWCKVTYLPTSWYSHADRSVGS